ncbi:hypothetical protein [Streptomyces sp. NPDC056883]|uniref:hypothetical protein n=1 Tax=Streptomyces sp. NPDC056883 TaxID=3345959 RepID=UPI003689A73C
MRITVPTMSETSSTSLTLAVETARAAARTAAHIAGLILIEADGGGGSIHTPRRGEGPAESWCIVFSTHFKAYLLADWHGERAHVELTGITPAAYEQMRTWAEDRDACYHDEDCECLDDPWPTLDFLTQSDGEECRIDYRDDREDQRGTARTAFGRINVTLYEELVCVVDTLIRIARAAA